MTGSKSAVPLGGGRCWCYKQALPGVWKTTLPKDKSLAQKTSCPWTWTIFNLLTGIWWKKRFSDRSVCFSKGECVWEHLQLYVCVFDRDEYLTDSVSCADLHTSCHFPLSLFCLLFSLTTEGLTQRVGPQNITRSQCWPPRVRPRWPPYVPAPCSPSWERQSREGQGMLTYGGWRLLFIHVSLWCLFWARLTQRLQWQHLIVCANNIWGINTVWETVQKKQAMASVVPMLSLFYIWLRD